MIDRRDPEKLGKALLHRHKAYGLTSEKHRSLSATYDANQRSLEGVDKYDARHAGPVEKYGKPGELIQLTEAAGPTFAQR